MLLDTLRPSEEHVANCLTSTVVFTRLGTLTMWLSRGQLGPGHINLETPGSDLREAAQVGEGSLQARLLPECLRVVRLLWQPSSPHMPVYTGSCLPGEEARTACPQGLAS